MENPYAKVSCTFVFFALLLLILTPLTVSAEEPGAVERILVIYPFAEIGDWGLEFNEGFYSEVNSYSSFKNSIYFHFLQIDISVNDQDGRNLRELENLAESYKLDFVVSLLPPVNNFLINYGEALFPGIPKILVAAVDSQVEQIENKDAYYYLKSGSTAAITETISDIKRMLPDIEHLYVHSGIGIADLPYLAIFKEHVTKYFDEELIDYWVGEPMNEILNRISRVPPNSAIMMLTSNSDKNGDTYTISDFFPLYSERAAAPVFSFYDNEFGMGVIGGTMTSADSYGRHTARIIDKIVGGNKELVIEEVDTSKKMYDWRQLQRWGIELKNVPGNAEIMFVEETFWMKYKEIVLITAIIVLLQTITIIFLVNQVRRRKILHYELENKHLQISQSLKEKEILLREVHHRVKNNLSLVISFLSLQSDVVNNEELLEVLGKLQNRIYAMSLVHEQLYKDNKIEQIDIKEYLRELCDSVIYSYHDKSELSVTYDLQVEEQNLTMDLMIPIGLVFNELVTNSIKHAFDGITDPSISIRGRKDTNRYIFEYRDNGVGFSGKSASKENDSLGMLIISTLMIQIEGDYKVDGSDGLRVSFSVPLLSN